MKRISWVLLLVLIISVGAYAGGGGQQAGSGTAAHVGREAPALAERVARGELPPLEQRLPAEPFVTSAPEIGRYGGIYQIGRAHV